MDVFIENCLYLDWLWHIFSNYFNGSLSYMQLFWLVSPVINMRTFADWVSGCAFEHLTDVFVAYGGSNFKVRTLILLLLWSSGRAIGHQNRLVFNLCSLGNIWWSIEVFGINFWLRCQSSIRIILKLSFGSRLRKTWKRIVDTLWCYGSHFIKILKHIGSTCRRPMSHLRNWSRRSVNTLWCQRSHVKRRPIIKIWTWKWPNITFRHLAIRYRRSIPLMPNAITLLHLPDLLVNWQCCRLPTNCYKSRSSLFALHLYRSIIALTLII